ncbi:MAG: TIGR00296 family protein [Thermoprotei archaeon]|nr:MAG: TIGR00296 family protein [Thermoprotei archaeon]
MEEPVHPAEISFSDGVFLVKLARKAVEEKLLRGIDIKPPSDTPEYMKRPGMTFTTIEKLLPDGRFVLRGCIGFLSPIYSLVESTIRSAVEAATSDPRFPPMKPEELNQVVFEVTVLSVPVEIKVEDRWMIPSKVVIGRDGLVVEKGFYKGTLLPIVPVEYCWDTETFLAETCLKAGLQPDCWLEPDTRIYRYEGRAFKEKAPLGSIYERDLSREYRESCSKPES